MGRANLEFVSNGSGQFISSKIIKRSCRKHENRDSRPKKYCDDPTPIPTQSGMARANPELVSNGLGRLISAEIIDN
jgi:hypothetical protein